MEEKDEESKNVEMEERYQQVILYLVLGPPRSVVIKYHCGFSENETQENGGEEMNTA